MKRKMFRSIMWLLCKLKICQKVYISAYGKEMIAYTYEEWWI